MIIVSQKVHNNASKINTKRNKQSVEKFNATNIETKTQAPQTRELSQLNSMVFLQEIDQQKEQDTQYLKLFSQKAFAELKKLQMLLLSGQINPDIIYNLRKILEQKKKFIIHDKKLAKLAEAIELRVEVEIAKLEQNQSA